MIPFPTPGSDDYLDAASLGKLQREIGENLVDGLGVDAARKELARAKAASESEDPYGG